MSGSYVRRAASLVAGLVMVGIAVLIGADVGGQAPKCTEFSESLRGRKSFAAPPCRFIDDGIYDVRIDTSEGVINVSLDTRLDGLSVNNFVFLAKVGFYDGITFHRVESDEEHAFVQTGDPGGTGKGTAGYTYKAEPPSPITQYVRGMVAMAHTGTLESTSSQFFIIVRDWEAISGPAVIPNYPFFGYVTDRESEAVLDRIVAAPRDGTRPDPPVRVNEVKIVRERGFFEEP